MVAKVVRLHYQRVGLPGFLRVLIGWSITLGGLILLTLQIRDAIPADLRSALADGTMAATATALGALPVLVIRQISQRTQGALLGFGAGVMLAASMFSLLLPGLDAAIARGATAGGAAAIVATGFVLGAALLLALERSVPHIHTPDKQHSITAVWLFVIAIAVHNIPEGLAIGVAAGETGVSAVATGISLQNMPEGLIVAIALASVGYSRALSFTVAALSGLIESVAALLGAAVVHFTAAALPWGLAAAAGAMIFVVSHEIIPESHKRGHETLATVGLIIGFVVMMLLDTLL